MKSLAYDLCCHSQGMALDPTEGRSGAVSIVVPLVLFGMTGNKPLDS
jgi:hypothetical protein